MTREQFENDARFATIDSADIGRLGGTGHRSKRACNAAAWLLDNGDGFAAVLDHYNMTVATLDDDGDVAWEPLADFEA